MKFIPRRLHAIFDLIIILYLIVSPWLFRMEVRSIPALMLFLTAAIIICYALLTKYELGIFRFMNFKNHLAIEFTLGLMLACSPWLLEFGGYTAMPHFSAGVSLMLIAACSSNKSIWVDVQEKTITF